MIRVILLLDFTESYAHRVLAGIQEYVKEHEPWVVCRMPPSYKHKNGIEGVVDWAVKWHASAIIGQFAPDEEVALFAQNGIKAIALDYIQRFESIPNVTCNYPQAGQEVAEYYLEKQFKNFAFFGYENVVWSKERQEGFFKTIAEAGYADHFYEYHNIEIENLWYYDYEPLARWLESLPEKTGLMACDDNQAIKITEACRAINKNIPEQLAVIGVDNDTTVCNLSDPPLTSYNLDVKSGGYRAAELIATMMKERTFIGEDIFIESLGIVHRASSNVFHTNDIYVAKAIKFINHNISSRLTVKDVLAQVPMSRRLFEIRFRKSTAMSIYQYIMHYRIQLLANLLINSEDSISDLAYQVGFLELKNVSRQFKQVMNCTPTQYRNKKIKK